MKATAAAWLRMRVELQSWTRATLSIAFAPSSGVEKPPRINQDSWKIKITFGGRIGRLRAIDGRSGNGPLASRPLREGGKERARRGLSRFRMDRFHGGRATESQPARFHPQFHSPRRLLFYAFSPFFSTSRLRHPSLPRVLFLARPPTPGIHDSI